MTLIVTYTNLEKESDVVIILRRQVLKNTFQNAGKFSEFSLCAIMA